MLLEDDIKKIKGVGDKAKEKYLRLNIESIGDLLEHYPREYDEVKPIQPINTLKEGDLAAIEGNMVSMLKMKKHGKLTILTTVMTDHSGGMIDVTWFNMPFLKNQLHMGTVYILRGRVARKYGRLVMEQPKLYSKQDFHRIERTLRPIYPLTGGLTNNALTKAVQTAIRETEDIYEYLPADIRSRQGLIGYEKAVRQIHFPENRAELLEARKRLVFDELFLYVLALRGIRDSMTESRSGHVIARSQDVDEFIKSLPYELTGAQIKAYEEIVGDMSSGLVMNRLVQGDVGSGKTIVALLAMLQAVKNGGQAALMVPTEVLAAQHVKTFREMLGEDVSVDMLTGSMSAKEKKEAKTGLKSGQTDILIGTHALIQEDVEFEKLSLVVTDEQHRFGVRQRETFFKKGERPHVLAMSATPIPRTLALILYGDMDLTVIDEKPVGRLPVKNALVNSSYRENAHVFIKNRIAAGEQAYVICPMIDEGEDDAIASVSICAGELANDLPASVRIGVLHGKMKPKEKNDVMEKFAAGEIDVLVSTTVVEVGVDVKNATTMLIENAERFGLATLHQLRGRVGRGDKQSYCIFMMGTEGKETRERLQILERSNDGFEVASEDLKRRGQGDLFGTLQSGENVFELADIYEDSAILEQAGAEAKNYSLEKLFSSQKDLTNEKASFHGNKNQNMRLLKRISQYMGEVTL
ncbi:MAG: ATP-dependent DNA helicase RecG [Eubacterium sp.]|nr:ATP-dependent DNA helicase RecG [Eubacterium sp.]